MSKTVQTNYQSARPKHTTPKGFYDIRVPKEVSGDMENPSSLIHAYVGEDSEFDGITEIVRETPRQYIVRMPKEVADNYVKSKHEEAKAMLKSSPGPGFTSDETRIKGEKVSIADSLMTSILEEARGEGNLE